MFGSILPRPRYDDFLCSVDDDDEESGGGGGAGDKDDKPKMFTQEQVNQIGSKEKKEGRRAAIRELLEELEIDSVDVLKETFAKAKEAEDAVKDETQKAKEKADRDAATAEATKKEAAKDRRAARLERMLAKAGVPEDKIDRALRNLDTDLDNEIDAEEVTAAIADLKKDLPTLFEDAGDGGEEDKDGKPNPPTPRPPQGPKAEGSTKDEAAALVKKLYPESKFAKGAAGQGS
jgi:hypothetical protein